MAEIGIAHVILGRCGEYRLLLEIIWHAATTFEVSTPPYQGSPSSTSYDPEKGNITPLDFFVVSSYSGGARAMSVSAMWRRPASIMFPLPCRPMNRPRNPVKLFDNPITYSLSEARKSNCRLSKRRLDTADLLQTVVLPERMMHAPNLA